MKYSIYIYIFGKIKIFFSSKADNKSYVMVYQYQIFLYIMLFFFF